MFRLLHASAWAVALGGLGLLAIEESGVLEELLRTSLVWRLGPLGEGLHIERVGLRWFEPGIVLENVSLRAPTGAQHPGQELLRLRAVHLSFDVDWESRRPLRRLQVDGGRIRISDTLLQGLERFSASVTGGKGKGLHLEPPPFLVTDFAIDVELPDGSVFDLGTVDLLADPDPEGGFRISGALTPSLAGAVPEPTRIHVDGRQWESGVELHASALDVPLSSSSFRMPAMLGAPPIDSFSGRLTLDATGRLEFGEKLQADGTLRAHLGEARLLPVRGHPWFEDLQVDVDAAFHPREENELWDRDSWTVASSLGASWNGTPVVAHAELGAGAPRGGWAHFWGRAERLPLAETTLEALVAMEPNEARRRDYREAWGAFSPSGVADASADVLLERLDDPSGEVRWESETAVHLRHVGESGLTFHGFHDLEGQRAGLPIPVTGLLGQTIYTHDATKPRPYRLAQIDMQGEHGSGIVQGWSVMTAPDPARAGAEPDLDLVFTIPELAIDERLRAALDQNVVTREIWPSYSPVGGTLSSTWRFESGPETGGITAVGKLEVKNTSLRWFELPVPVDGTSGKLTLLWSEKPSAVRDATPGTRYRPFGVVYDLRNDDASSRRGVKARISGSAREDDLPPVVDRADIPEWWIQGIDVWIDDLLLRGKDWDVLTSAFPELGEQALELGARGGVNVHFVGGRPSPDATYVSDVEATPNVVEVMPRFFQRNTQDIAGRVLVRSKSFDDGREDEYEMRLVMSGAWPGGVELAVEARIPSTGNALIDTFGAGLDTTNTAFRGALIKLLTTEEELGGAGFDLSPSDFTKSDLHGRIDFSVRSTWVDPEDPAENAFRVFLRDNTLEHENLRLEGLRGVLAQAGDIMRSPRILGAITGHPIELDDVVVFALDRAAELPDADPIFLRSDLSGDPDALGMQAVLHTLDLPLDAEHLSSVLDEETLSVLGESGGWRGKLDVLGAHLLLTSTSDEDRDMLVLHGPLRPHDLSLRFGFPIEMSTADVDVREFVSEAGRFRGWGEIENMTAEIAGRELSGASMILGYVDGRLTIDNLSGDFEGGRLESLGGSGPGARKAIGVDMADPYRFDVAIRMDQVHVDQLMRGVFHSTIGDAGLLDASLQLSGTPGEVLGLTGRGHLKLDEGRLWSIPTMRELFSQLGFPNTAVFDRMRARFELRDGVIQTNYLEVRSALLNLVGSGTLDLDGELDYDLDVRYSLLDKLGIFNRLLYWLNNSLWRVAVHGSFARPFVTIRKPFLELFQRSKDLPRALPLPPFAPQAPRF